MPQEVDEYGIPIKKTVQQAQPQQEVDEFGIPIKKKASTQEPTIPTIPLDGSKPLQNGGVTSPTSTSTSKSTLGRDDKPVSPLTKTVVDGNNAEMAKQAQEQQVKNKNLFSGILSGKKPTTSLVSPENLEANIHDANKRQDITERFYKGDLKEEDLEAYGVKPNMGIDLPQLTNAINQKNKNLATISNLTQTQSIMPALQEWGNVKKDMERLNNQRQNLASRFVTPSQQDYEKIDSQLNNLKDKENFIKHGIDVVYNHKYTTEYQPQLLQLPALQKYIEKAALDYEGKLKSLNPEQRKGSPLGQAHIFDESDQYAIRKIVHDYMSNKNDVIAAAKEHGAGLALGENLKNTEYTDVENRIIDHIETAIPVQHATRKYNEQVAKSNPSLKSFIDNGHNIKDTFSPEKYAQANSLAETHFNNDVLSANDNFNKALDANEAGKGIMQKWASQVESKMVTPEIAQKNIIRDLQNNKETSALVKKREADIKNAKDKANDVRKGFLIGALQSANKDVSVYPDGSIGIKGMTKSQSQKALEDYYKGLGEVENKTLEAVSKARGRKADEVLADKGTYMASVDQAYKNMMYGLSAFMYAKTGHGGDAARVYNSSLSANNVDLSSVAKEHFEYKGLNSLKSWDYWQHFLGSSTPLIAGATVLGAATGGIGEGAVALGAPEVVGTGLATVGNAGYMTAANLANSYGSLLKQGVNTYDASTATSNIAANDLLFNTFTGYLQSASLFGKTLKPTLLKTATNLTKNIAANTAMMTNQGLLQETAQSEALGNEKPNIVDYVKKHGVDSFVSALSFLPMDLYHGVKGHLASMKNWNELLNTTSAEIHQNKFYNNNIQHAINDNSASLIDNLMLMKENGDYKTDNEAETKANKISLENAILHAQGLERNIANAKLDRYNINDLYTAHNLTLADMHDALSKQLAGDNGENKALADFHKAKSKEYQEEASKSMNNEASFHYLVDGNDNPVILSDKALKVMTENGDIKKGMDKGYIKDVVKSDDAEFASKYRKQLFEAEQLEKEAKKAKGEQAPIEKGTDNFVSKENEFEGRPIFSDYHSTIAKDGELIPFGKEVKQRLENGEKVTIVTKSGKDNPEENKAEILKTMGLSPEAEKNLTIVQGLSGEEKASLAEKSGGVLIDNSNAVAGEVEKLGLGADIKFINANELNKREVAAEKATEPQQVEEKPTTPTPTKEEVSVPSEVKSKFAAFKEKHLAPQVSDIPLTVSDKKEWEVNLSMDEKLDLARQNLPQVTDNMSDREIIELANKNAPILLAKIRGEDISTPINLSVENTSQKTTKLPSLSERLEAARSTSPEVTEEPLKLAQNDIEHEHAIEKLSEQDNVVLQPTITAIESKAENPSGIGSKELSNTEAEITEIVNKATGVVDYPISGISTNEAEYQGRKNKFSERSAKNVAENYDPNKFDPIVIYKHPNGKTYVLSGHSRFEGMKRRGEKTIPARLFEGTPQEAKDFAQKSNKFGTLQTDIENAAYYRDKLLKGESYNSILEEAKENEQEGSAKRIVSLAHLNPNGKAIQALELLGKGEGDSSANVLTVASKIGNIRAKNEHLTDAHENELFDYMVSDRKNIPTDAELLDPNNTLNRSINTAKFYPNEPLNLDKFVSKSENRVQWEKEKREIEATQKELRQQVNPSKKTGWTGLKEKAIALLSKGDNSKEGIEKAVTDFEKNKDGVKDAYQKQLEQKRAELSVVNDKLAKHLLKEKDLIEGDKAQGSLFQFKGPTPEAISEMKDIVKGLVDSGVTKLSDIQKMAAQELGNNSKELANAVEDAYNEYTRTETPKEITSGVVGRVGQFLSRLLGGKGSERIFFKGEKSLRAKAEELSGSKSIKFQLADGTKIEGKTMPEVVNGFYSPLEKTIAETKFDKLPSKQWIEKFAKGEEAKWTGLTDWLNKQEGSVSKADIKKYLKDNRIEVVEVVKGDNLPLKGATKKRQDLIEKAERLGYTFNWYSTRDTYPKITTTDGVAIEKDKIPSEVLDLADSAQKLTKEVNTEPIQDTKYEQYQLGGEKSNYKEVLITLPQKESVETKKENVRKIQQYNLLVYKEQEFLDKLGVRIPTKEEKAQYEKIKQQLKEAKDNLPENVVIGNRGLISEDFYKKDGFKSSHFEEPNILSHLRMNTRTDAEGNRVLFLEELQSDWGQKGKKEGFKDNSKLTEKETELKKLRDKGIDNLSLEEKKRYSDLMVDGTWKLLREKDFGATPSAPFVTDTNSWTKLALKTALKEAVEQGADKISWTTGEQQNERYDLSKQVDKIEVEAVEGQKGLHFVDIKLSNGETENLEVENGIIREGKYKGQRLDSIIGKEYADKVLSIPEGEYKTLEGEDLKLGGKGMKGFYGSTKEGSLGIVGNVAKSLFKQEPKILNLSNEETFLVKKNRSYGYDVISSKDGVISNEASEKEANDYAKMMKERFGGKEQIQHSIDITPELRKQVQEQGQPLFMKDAKGKILGFTQDGKIYLNSEAINPNTPIHESGHIWVEHAKQNNPEIYNRGIELVSEKGNRYLEKVKANKFYQDEANKLPENEIEEYYQHEALATAIGDKGAQFVTEAKKATFKEWLNNLWNSIKEAAGFKGITADELQNLTFEEFAKRAAKEILGETPTEDNANIGREDVVEDRGLVLPTPIVPPITEPISEEGAEPVYKGVTMEAQSQIDSIAKKYADRVGVTWEEDLRDGLSRAQSLYPNSDIKEASRLYTEQKYRDMQESGGNYVPSSQDIMTFNYHLKNLFDELNSPEPTRLRDDVLNDIQRTSDVLSNSKTGRALAAYKAILLEDNNGLQVMRADLESKNGGKPLSEEQNKMTAAFWEEQKEALIKEQELQLQDLREQAQLQLEQVKSEYEAKLKSQTKPSKETPTEKKKSEIIKKSADEIAALIRKGINKDAAYSDPFLVGTGMNIVLEGVAKLVEEVGSLAGAIAKYIEDNPKFKGKEKDIEDAIFNHINLQEKKDKAIDGIEKLGGETITKEMVEKKYIKDFVDSFLTNHDISEVIGKSTKQLQKILPNVTEDEVRKAYLKKDQFEIPTEAKVKADLQQSKADLANLLKVQDKLDKLIETGKLETNPAKKKVINQKIDAARKEVEDELLRQGKKKGNLSSTEKDALAKVSESQNKHINDVLSFVDRIGKGLDNNKNFQILKDSINNLRFNFDPTDASEQKNLRQKEIDASAKDIISQLDKDWKEYGLTKEEKKLINQQVQGISDFTKRLIENARQDVLVDNEIKNLKAKAKEYDRKLNAGEFDDEPILPKRTKTSYELLQAQKEFSAAKSGYEAAAKKVSEDNLASLKDKLLSKDWWFSSALRSVRRIYTASVIAFSFGKVLYSGFTRPKFEALKRATLGKAVTAFLSDAMLLKAKEGGYSTSSTAVGKLLPQSLSLSRIKEYGIKTLFRGLTQEEIFKEADRLNSVYDKSFNDYLEQKKLVEGLSENSPKLKEEQAKLNKLEKEFNNNKLKLALNAPLLTIGGSSMDLLFDKWINGASNFEASNWKFNRYSYKDVIENASKDKPIKSVADAMGYAISLMTTNAHSAFKSLSGRAFYLAAFSARMEHAIETGQDVFKPSKIDEIHLASLQDYQFGMYMQENAINKAAQAALTAISKDLPLTSSIIKLDQPVTRVPTNQAILLTDYMFGWLKAAAIKKQVFSTAREQARQRIALLGLENDKATIKRELQAEIYKLDPQIAATFVRHLVNGSVGGVGALLALTGALAYGGSKHLGYQAEDEKKKQMKDVLLTEQTNLFGGSLGKHIDLLAHTDEIRTMLTIAAMKNEWAYNRKAGKSTLGNSVYVADKFLTELEQQVPPAKAIGMYELAKNAARAVINTPDKLVEGTVSPKYNKYIRENNKHQTEYRKEIVHDVENNKISETEAQLKINSASEKYENKAKYLKKLGIIDKKYTDELFDVRFLPKDKQHQATMDIKAKMKKEKQDYIQKEGIQNLHLPLE
jgi:hypothetical protein